MKKSVLFNLIWLLLPLSAFSQQFGLEKSVRLRAEIRNNPPSIQLLWEKTTKVQATHIFRKQVHETNWGEPVAKLRGSATQYADREVVRGASYEYKVWQQYKNGSAYGYLFSAIGNPVVHFRGKLLLLVDNTVASPLKTELYRFKQDLEGDGWQVIRIDISPLLSVKKVKQRITSAYFADPSNTKSLILFGHIPVPYSGNICPDRHGDHTGAWPADVYYADMDGEWTDVKVNTLTAIDPRNHNVPGDGKFDQNLMASPPELQTGRIDFSNLTVFEQSEVELLRAYLDKNHKFRQKQFVPKARGLIENNFKTFTEGFSQNGWKNFSPLIGPDQITEADYTGTLKRGSYLWAYGCGAGSFTSCNGVINSKDFAADSLQAVFNLLFGSYFGDWDGKNNLLRASLGSGSLLTSCWAGRPNWQFHHMALGYPIGYSVVLSQSNHQLYDPGYAARNIHIALMGDPTLRMKMVEPPKNVQINLLGDAVDLFWDIPDDHIIGYHIYRKERKSGNFHLLNQHLITTNSYQETCLARGEYIYMVRAIKLETSPSGTYYNLSQGAYSPVAHVKTDGEISSNFEFETQGTQVAFINNSVNADQFLWTFGDGNTSRLKNPVHKFLEPGAYEVRLKASNSCAEENYDLVLTLQVPELKNEEKMSGFNIFPNPTSEYLNVHIYSNEQSNYKVLVFDLDARLMKENNVGFQGSSTLYALDIRDLAKGVYIIQVFDRIDKIGAKKFVLN